MITSQCSPGHYCRTDKCTICESRSNKLCCKSGLTRLIRRTVLTSGLITVIMFYLPFPPGYKLLFTIPNITIANIMAARVYRNTKFERYKDYPLPSIQLRFSTSEPEGGSHSSTMPVSFSAGTPITQPGNSTFSTAEGVQNTHPGSEGNNINIGCPENRHGVENYIRNNGHTLARVSQYISPDRTLRLKCTVNSLQE